MSDYRDATDFPTTDELARKDERYGPLGHETCRHGNREDFCNTCVGERILALERELASRVPNTGPYHCPACERLHWWDEGSRVYDAHYRGVKA